MANLLASETSPYLIRHKDNPVNWRTWGPEAQAEAERLGKPIFLSIGFNSCRWCQLMERENFQDTDVAALLNENFVCVLVDREERPDLDSIYQSAAQMLNSPGGWPLNMFLTAKGEPFGSGNFFPKEDQPQIGVIGFKTAIGNILNVLKGDGAQIAQNIEALRGALARQWEQNRRIDGQLSPFALEQAARKVCQRLDVFSGGLNGVPKFPNVPIIEMMWRAWTRTSAVQFANAVETQLRQMCLSGIYDHVGGGFARFANDEYWLVPHFEKMINDNALLIEMMTVVWQESRLPLYKTRVEETIGWIQREMTTPEGAFAAGLSAEAEGVEGAHYVWTAGEIDAILGAEDAKIFKQVFDVRDGGNWQGKSILHRLAFPQVDPMIEGRLNGMRQKLLDARGKRPKAALDDLVLTDFNAMTIRALTVAADAFNRIEWQAMAVRAFWFVADKMGAGSKLSHSFRAGKVSKHDFAEDYVYMAWAGLALYESTGDIRYLEKAQAWYSELGQRFWTETAGGFTQAPSESDTLFVRPRVGIDGSTPSSNGLAAKVAAHLYFHTGSTHYRDRANEIMASLGQDALVNIHMHAGIFNALDSIVRALQIVVVGDRQSPEVNAIRDVLRRVSLPNKIVQIVSNAESLPSTHPAFGKPRIQGRATVYLCNSTQCSPPLVDPNQIELALKTRTTTVPMPRS